MCGEDGRGEEVVQCGSMVVLMTVSKQDQEGFIKVRAISCCHFFVVSHDSWFDCSVLFSSPPFQTLWLQSVALSVFLSLWLHSPLGTSQWAFNPSDIPVRSGMDISILLGTKSYLVTCLRSDHEFGLELKTGLFF